MPLSLRTGAALGALALSLCLPVTGQAQTAAARPGVAVPAQWRAATFAETVPASGGGVLVLPLASADEARLARLDPALREGVGRALASADFKFDSRKTLVLRGLGA